MSATPERKVQVLAIGADASIADEVGAVLQEERNTLRFANGLAEGMDAVRRRVPELVLVELGDDAKALREFANELRALASDCVLIGLRSGSHREDEAPGAVLVEALRARFDDVVRRPLSSAELRPWLTRAASRSRDSRGREGVAVAFHSTKGGVGKSTLAVNVACALAAGRPDRVLLIDASIQLGVCAAALDLEPLATLADAARERQRLDDTMLRQLASRHHTGLRVLAAPRDAVEAAEVDEEALGRVLGAARRAFDFVLIDTLPIVDGISLTILEACERAYLVNQGTVPDVIGAARLLAVLDGVGLGAERRAIVLNRNTPRFAGSLSAAQVEDRLGCAIDHEVPWERRVFTGLNLGEPFALRASRRFGWGRAIAGIAADIERLATRRGDA